jgi:hypothetical protein
MKSYLPTIAKANQMAHYFWSQGLRPNEIVTVSLDRSHFIAAIFAVLQWCMLRSYR